MAMDVKVGHVVIKAEPNVKLLGVHIDNAFNFNNHVSYLCQKAGYKLNVVRISEPRIDIHKQRKYSFNTLIPKINKICDIQSGQ